MNFTDQIYELIKKTASSLPADIKKKILNEKNSDVLNVIKEAIYISEEQKIPICQDTGYPYFLIEIPEKQIDKKPIIEKSIIEAIKKATKNSFLRPNSVDPISNINFGNNLGLNLPYVEWDITTGNNTFCNLLLKGGGSENVSMQYSLPFNKINAGRDIKGIINTVLFHIQKIQGQGCSPGFLGIGIGGDRAFSMKLAKKQLFRKIEDINDDKDLAYIEKEILTSGNKLEIGPMGLGGNPTLLAVKAAKAARHPASFFVSISYLCWVARRNKCQLNIH